MPRRGCPNDTDGDGGCGRYACPHCAPERTAAPVLLVADYRHVASLRCHRDCTRLAVYDQAFAEDAFAALQRQGWRHLRREHPLTGAVDEQWVCAQHAGGVRAGPGSVTPIP